MPKLSLHPKSSAGYGHSPVLACAILARFLLLSHIPFSTMFERTKWRHSKIIILVGSLKRVRPNRPLHDQQYRTSHLVGRCFAKKKDPSHEPHQRDLLLPRVTPRYSGDNLNIRMKQNHNTSEQQSHPNDDESVNSRAAPKAGYEIAESTASTTSKSHTFTACLDKGIRLHESRLTTTSMVVELAFVCFSFR